MLVDLPVVLPAVLYLSQECYYVPHFVANSVACHFSGLMQAFFNSGIRNLKTNFNSRPKTWTTTRTSPGVDFANSQYWPESFSGKFKFSINFHTDIEENIPSPNCALNALKSCERSRIYEFTNLTLSANYDQNRKLRK
jgi:hypothetical protein